TPAVAIVGSRDHTAYGADVCRMIARAAAGCGVTVVSGMARGLDAVAHRSALEAGGATIGVLGNGLGVIYPAANRELYEAVGGAGLLLTEFPPGERPFPGSFPRRNRLISGLAQVTVVAEAAQGSGALITAGTALDQGRDVMAVPGPITSRTSAGTNAPLRDGAEPPLSMEDLLAHFPGAVDTALEPGGRAPSAAGRHAPVTGPTATITSAPPAEPAPVPIPAEFSAVAGCLGRELVHIDAISIVSGQPPGEVLAVLAQLELIGAVEQHPGGLFRRT